jgi:3-hydroxyacyl-CoA dehydrogenase
MISPRLSHRRTSSKSKVQKMPPSSLWPKVEQDCPSKALLWSSTSGIPASIQCADMKDPSRLIVVHPYNPPHIMPLLEIVPSPATDQEVIARTMEYWKDTVQMPLVLKKETTGFVANRLAFALLREAIHLVNEGVASVKDVDDLMASSMGPRWAVAGIFDSYHAGGGVGGLEGFFKNIGGTVQACWDDIGILNVGEGWEEDIFRQTKETYGVLYTKERDDKTRRVLDAAKTKE